MLQLSFDSFWVIRRKLQQTSCFLHTSQLSQCSCKSWLQVWRGSKSLEPELDFWEAFLQNIINHGGCENLTAVTETGGKLSSACHLHLLLSCHEDEDSMFLWNTGLSPNYNPLHNQSCCYSNLTRFSNSVNWSEVLKTSINMAYLKEEHLFLQSGCSLILSCRWVCFHLLFHFLQCAFLGFKFFSKCLYIS